MDLDIAFTSTITKTRTFSVKPPDSEAELLISISGTVHLKGNTDKVISDATVVAKEVGMTARTNEKGEYAFTRIAEGKHTISVQLPDRKTREFNITVPGPNYDLEV